MPDEKKQHEPVGRARRRLDLALLALALGAAFWQWHYHGAQYRSAARIIRQRVFPCSSPITYSIGAIDPRYNITPGELAAAVAEAKAVWEAPLKRDLFEFAASSGDVTINMVYDRRQASVDKLNEIGLHTEHGQASYQALKARYDELSAEVDPRQAQLRARLAVYRRGADAYNAAVAGYNRRGTATPRQRRRLNAVRLALEREFAGIKRFEADVNGDIEVLNAIATALNQLIVELKMDVAQYNREGSALGVFEEGNYSVAGGLRAITVYKYSDHTQLVRLLAHELGHALGLEHVAAPEALMAPINQSRTLDLSKDDLAELGWACASPLGRKKRR